jgi:hypothetical protein
MAYALESWQLSAPHRSCEACKPLCPTCREILKRPEYQTCRCFTCPACGRRNTEIMLHTCGREPSYLSVYGPSYANLPGTILDTFKAMYKAGDSD